MIHMQSSIHLLAIVISLGSVDASFTLHALEVSPCAPIIFALLDTHTSSSTILQSFKWLIVLTSPKTLARSIKIDQALWQHYGCLRQGLMTSTIGGV